MNAEWIPYSGGVKNVLPRNMHRVTTDLVVIIAAAGLSDSRSGCLWLERYVQTDLKLLCWACHLRPHIGAMLMLSLP